MVKYKNINTGAEFETTEKKFKILKDNPVIGKAFVRISPKKASDPEEVKAAKKAAIGSKEPAKQ